MVHVSDSETATISSGALAAHVGEVVTLNGLVETLRDQKRMQFVVLRSGDRLVQISHDKLSERSDLTAAISSLTPGSALTVRGEVKDAPHVRLGGIELSALDVTIHSLAESPLPIAADSSIDKQIDWRPLSLRRADQQLIFRVQTSLEHAMRVFWAREGFVELHSPKLMGTFSESGAEAFEVSYFERKAYLAQSPQFYKQMAIAGGFERVFEIGPAFRAEPSFTSRHETEFTSIDMELAWTRSHEDVMALEERLLAFAIAYVKEAHGAEIAEIFGVDIFMPSIPFPRISMAEAQAIVRATGYRSMKVDDLDPEAERRLCAHVLAERGHEFVFVTDYPASVRPFYHRRSETDANLTQSFDLLWNGVEVTTGAQREHRYDRLKAQALARGYDLAPLAAYLDFFRYGCPPHGGMGLGLARLLMMMLKRPSIRDVTLVSRTPTRLSP